MTSLNDEMMGSAMLRPTPLAGRAATYRL